MSDIVAVPAPARRMSRGKRYLFGVLVLVALIVLAEAASFVSSSGYCELAHKPVVILLVGPPGRHQAAMPAWRGQDG